jgi:DNA polymerase I
MGYRNLAFRINRDEAHAKELLRNHREAFPEYWKWSDRQETRGMIGLPLSTVFGWQTYGSKDCKPLTFRNFPSQANGAEMLRVSILGLVKAGIKVCAPIHDAVLIEAPLEEIDSTVTLARAIMERASRVILPGFTIRTESKIVRYPDSWEEPLGHALWTKVMELLDRTSPAKGVGENHPHSMLVTPTTV